MNIDQLIEAIAESLQDRKDLLAKAAVTHDRARLDEIAATLHSYVADDGFFLLQLAQAVNELTAEVADLRKV